MSGVVTRKFRLAVSDALVESFSEAAPSRYFVFVGRINAYANDSAPTTPTDTIQNISYDAFRDMIAMKRVQASDVSYVVPRYNWTNNTVYQQYSDIRTNLYPTSSSPTSNTTFYVLTEDNNVYKVIDNARGVVSTVKPTGTGTSITTTADGYRWKFLYTVSSADAGKFLTAGYMPVKKLTANNGSAQWTVQQAAANGSIDHIAVGANGSGYLTTSNTFATVTNSTVMILNTNASQSDDIYNKSTLYISSGLGSGQIRRVINYVGLTRTITVNGAFTTTPNTSSRYIVGPNVIIRGDSGSTTSNRASAYVSNTVGGTIRKITMIAPGLHYSTANVTFSANSSHGSGATANVVISPFGGHGSNPVYELGASNIMLNVRISGSESNTFPTNNDFRIIGLIMDPSLRGGPVANASVIDTCTRITVTSLNGDLTADEVITGGTSGAKARFVAFANTNAARTAGIVRVIRVTTNGNGGTFRVGETITGGTSGKTAVVSVFTKPAIREYTGQVVYTENRTPITRASDQTEDIKFVVKF